VMLSVEEAQTRIVSAFVPLPSERIGIAHALGRVLAEDAVARLTQPPFDVSSMDGYAVRAGDVAKIPAQLKIIGEAPAGRPFKGSVGAGETVRIYTGAVVPDGADAIVIQENTEADGKVVTIKAGTERGKHIRRTGLDFRQGDTLIARGRYLTARDITLLAAGDLAQVAVTRKPSIAVVATGDELARPGEKRAPGGIVASSNYGIVALVEKWCGVAVDLGILPDKAEAFAALPRATKDCDLIVTLGGASVGDHDLVQSALTPLGFALDFWKIAMRPGKPLIFGRLNKTPLLGLPGNPVSAIVCAVLFLRPAMAKMLGEPPYQPTMLKARLTSPLKANDSRQDYIRARIIRHDGEAYVEPFPVQDSSMQKALAEADGLIVRAPHVPAAAAGHMADVMVLDDC
jgi:molybdopterin molybdotransferase